MAESRADDDFSAASSPQLLMPAAEPLDEAIALMAPTGEPAEGSRWWAERSIASQLVSINLREAQNRVDTRPPFSRVDCKARGEAT